MPTNTKESGFEALIVNWLVEHNGYEEGSNADYNKEYAIDETRLFRFLQDTQPEQLEKLGIRKSHQKYAQFLNRLQGEISKRGIVDVLRNGIKVYPADLIMFYLTPSEGNAKAKELFQKNIFSVTRQLRYSQDAAKLALDLCVFINGLPVITFELKNQITKQNVDDAVQQYKDDRDSREMLFQFKRCMVHFAVDDARIKFCTKLAGQDSWFLPFDKGYNDGAGNPPNPNGIMTDYLWKDILTKEKLTLIIENYAQVIVEVDEDTKKKKEKQIFPRYHQLDVVTRLLADVKGKRRWEKVSHSAQRRQRKIQLYRLACSPAYRAGTGRSPDAGFRYCSHRPPDSRQADSGYYQAVHAGRQHGRMGGALRRSYESHYRWKAYYRDHD